MTELDYMLNTKPDIQAIYDSIPEGSRVLDLGCGDGSLLELLRDKKNCKVQGIDRDQAEVMKCIAKGIPVIQTNLDQGLSYFQDKSFDYVILGLTFQQIRQPHKLLFEMVRVSNFSIVSVFNLGYIKTRFQIFFGGIMPVNKRLPYEWYNTPNLHLGTEKDFCTMCEKESFQISSTKRISRSSDFLTNTFPNLFAEICIFTISG
ncbi:MAG: methionine biosynthesis protein MetW [Lentisphaeraceae bacterium]|nr:methionine biosynthesis protein MetW [Lentisphaeraceae bacterium]